MTTAVLLVMPLNKMEDDEEDMMKLWRVSLELKPDWPKVFHIIQTFKIRYVHTIYVYTNW